MKNKIILASGSPRRKALLSELGIEFQILKPDVDESRLSGEAPCELCERLARLKAEAAAGKFDCEKESIVVAADTIVVIDGQILGKPADRRDAFRMLNMLQGREHEVMTGLALCHGRKIISCVERSFVKFRNLSESEIAAYTSSGECDDKAGAYAVQGLGALLIESVRGDFYNVVGLPVFRLGKMLEELGLTLVELLKAGQRETCI